MNTVLKVTSIDKGSQAEQLGIKFGDLLKKYHNQPVPTNLALNKAISTTNEKGVTGRRIEIIRNGESLAFNVTAEPLGMNCEEASSSIAPPELRGSDYQARHDYQTTSGISSFVIFVGWMLVIGAVIGAVVALEGSSRFGGFSLLAITPMIGVLVGGLFLIMSGQITRAALDNANYSREMLEIMRRSKK